MQVVKSALRELSKKQRNHQHVSYLQEVNSNGQSTSEKIFTFIMTLPNGRMTVYLGPKLFEIFQNLYNILESGNISYDEIRNWGYDYGLNLAGITTGALIGYKLCSLLSISNPALKVTTILGLSYLGDQTIEFYKTLKNSEFELTLEEIQTILTLDQELTPKVIKFIQEHYLEISVFFINEII